MKFEVGEFAMLVNLNKYSAFNGMIVCIMEIDPSRIIKGKLIPYRTDLTPVKGASGWACDDVLRKLPPRQEPASLTRSLEIAA